MIISIAIIFIIVIAIVTIFFTKHKLKQYELKQVQLQQQLSELEEQRHQIQVSIASLKSQEQSITAYNDNLKIASQETQKIQLELEAKFNEEAKALQDITLQVNNKKQELETMKKSFEADYEKAKEEFNNKIDILSKKVIPLAECIDEYKARQKVLINMFLDKEEQLAKDRFNSLVLSASDKNDIKLLCEVAQHINKKEVVNKIIWTSYYQRPLTELLNRLFQGNQKICGIYKITNKQNRKIYIGQSRNVRERIIQHVKSALEIGTVAKSNLYLAMKEEDIDNFTFELVEECEQEQLNDKEKYWIQFFESNIYGYNMKI